MTKIAILTGGTSSEREIALRSAENVSFALAARYAVTLFDFPNDADRFLLARREFVCAIPMFHGKGGEDGEIQGFLKTLGIPFIFSDVAAHAIAMDKVATKSILSTHGIQTPVGRTLAHDGHVAYERPIVVKPVDVGSSIGVTIARSQIELDAGIAKTRSISRRIMLEECIEGEEYTCAIIEENGKDVALPVIQIKSKNAFFDLESKYDPLLVEEICPAPIPDKLSQDIQDIALRAHKIIGARHVSRSDFIVDAGGIVWFLEINTIPGMTEHSLLPKALQASGRSLGDACDGWVRSAMTDVR